MTRRPGKEVVVAQPRSGDLVHQPTTAVPATAGEEEILLDLARPPEARARMTRAGSPPIAQRIGTKEDPAPLLGFTMLWPPSTNKHWRPVIVPLRGGGQRAAQVPTKEVVAYREAAAYDLNKQHVPRREIADRLKVVWVLHEPIDVRVRDVLNFVKVPEDVLTLHAIIRDDSQFDDLRVLRGETAAAAYLEVAIWSIGPPKPDKRDQGDLLRAAVTRSRRR